MAQSSSASFKWTSSFIGPPPIAPSEAASMRLRSSMTVHMLRCMATYSPSSIRPDLSKSISFQRKSSSLRTCGRNLNESRSSSAFKVYIGWNFGARPFGSYSLLRVVCRSSACSPWNSTEALTPTRGGLSTKCCNSWSEIEPPPSRSSTPTSQATSTLEYSASGGESLESSRLNSNASKEPEPSASNDAKSASTRVATSAAAVVPRAHSRFSRRSKIVSLSHCSTVTAFAMSSSALLGRCSSHSGGTTVAVRVGAFASAARASMWRWTSPWPTGFLAPTHSCLRPRQNPDSADASSRIA
mmetsp:Transcript_15688/g.52853  ORF Transcript_15688/g.52853 Transcript_15688/m.52853 type:complete len:299 (-) Transcript_15688:32-928(-)